MTSFQRKQTGEFLYLLSKASFCIEFSSWKARALKEQKAKFRLLMRAILRKLLLVLND